MAEVKIQTPNIKLSGTGAVIVIILAVGLYGFGVFRSLSNFQNAALEEVLRTELGMDVGNQALQELEQMVERVWRARADRYSEERSALTGPQPKKIEMYQIGG